MTAAVISSTPTPRRRLTVLPDTHGWRIQYRYTATERRRVQFIAPDGVVWEVVSPAKATHVRKHGAGLTSTYLRRARGVTAQYSLLSSGGAQ